MNDLDKQYQNLLADILISGRNKEDRTGTGTRSVFGRQIRHDMRDGFPLLTTKKMAWKTMVTELLWFLRGDTNIKYLVVIFGMEMLIKTMLLKHHLIQVINLLKKNSLTK